MIVVRTAESAERGRRQQAQELIRLDADTFNRLTGTGNLLRDALAMLAAAAWWANRRLGIDEPLWTLIGLHVRGRPLAAPG